MAHRRITCETTSLPSAPTSTPREAAMAKDKRKSEPDPETEAAELQVEDQVEEQAEEQSGERPDPGIDPQAQYRVVLTRETPWRGTALSPGIELKLKGETLLEVLDAA